MSLGSGFSQFERVPGLAVCFSVAACGLEAPGRAPGAGVRDALVPTRSVTAQSDRRGFAQEREGSEWRTPRAEGFGVRHRRPGGRKPLEPRPQRWGI